MNFLTNLWGKQDLISIGKGFLIAELGAVLATATLWLQSVATKGNFDFHLLLVMEMGAVVSTLVNFARKLFDGKVE